MLDPYSIAHTANQEMMNIQPKVEDAIVEAANSGKSSILFDWENDELEAQFVEKYRDDKEVFSKGFEIGFGSKGITVSWEEIM
ncbi:hypothetical protein JK159_08370 [Weissella minor]|uniref:hypothetical protein n=1 Tax=Weissella minor TaxID=1620 RepID=UPI001BAEE246|nr:hypothetical protein [Weissella minor]MBS0950369.1 hypothetical protein [Weissella minor]